MSHERLRGVFPILVTPFDESDRVDEDSLRSVVDYTIDAGVHGLGIAFAISFGIGGIDTAGKWWAKYLSPTE